jgi:hypothetical protein
MRKNTYETEGYRSSRESGGERWVLQEQRGARAKRGDANEGDILLYATQHKEKTPGRGYVQICVSGNSHAKIALTCVTSLKFSRIQHPLICATRLAPLV